MPKTRDRNAGCTDCGSPAVRIILGGEPLCDHCHDVRVAAETGLPRLPDPPKPEIIVGPDGRRHRITYRVWRSPAGVVVEAEEALPDTEGHAAKVHGGHEASVDALIAKVMGEIRTRIARSDLELSGHGSHLIMRGLELRGRLVWDGRHGGPYGVVVDGRQLSWEELGRVLEPFEGWEFHLTFDDGLDRDEDPVQPPDVEPGAADLWPQPPGHVH